MLNSIRTALLLSFAFVLSGCDRSEVGDVSLGMFTLKDIKINNLTDPVVTGVTCHVASIEADLSLADPSDSSISCRQTGEITPEMIAQIDKSSSGEVVFQNQSIFFKSMKIRRIFDAKNQTLMYLSYWLKKHPAALNTACLLCRCGAPAYNAFPETQNK